MGHFCRTDLPSRTDRIGERYTISELLETNLTDARVAIARSVMLA